MTEYCPLFIAKQTDRTGKLSRIFREINDEFDENDKDFIEFMLSEDFLTDEIDDKFEKFKNMNSWIMLSQIKLMKAFYETQDIIGERTDIIKKIFPAIRSKNEVRSSLLINNVINSWAENKQCFRPTYHAIEQLLDFNEITISKEDVCNMAIKSLYTDVTKMTSSGPMIATGRLNGTFVKLFEFDDYLVIMIYGIIMDEEDFGALPAITIRCDYDKDNLIKINSKDMMNLTNWKKDFDQWGDEYYDKRNSITNEDVVKLAVSIMFHEKLNGVILTDSEETKNTYRPRNKCSKVRNKFSELRIVDMDIVVEDKPKEESEKPKKEEKKTPKQPTKKTKAKPKMKKKSKPTQGHWAKYWCGTGEDRHIERRWIEPK